VSPRQIPPKDLKKFRQQREAGVLQDSVGQPKVGMAPATALRPAETHH